LEFRTVVSDCSNTADTCNHNFVYHHRSVRSTQSLTILRPEFDPMTQVDSVAWRRERTIEGSCILTELNFDGVSPTLA
jgi:hypothetical protein